MKPERLSDAQLAALVREEGAAAEAAQRELENRHLGAVRAYADICAPGPAGEELAARAWRQAVRNPEAGVTAAFRPAALRSVLRAASELTGSGYPGWLDAELAAWLAMLPESWGGNHAGGDAAFLGHSPAVAWAFNALPVTVQTVLWHHLVERSENETVARFLGQDSPEAHEVSVLIRRAHRGFYRAYEQIHHGRMSDDCRRFHRMVMAYAGRADREVGNTGDVVTHLEGCAYCSRAVADLEQLGTQPGELLARELLPWGGERYAASRGAESERVSGTIRVATEAVPYEGSGAAAVAEPPPAADVAAPGRRPRGRGSAGRRPASRARRLSLAMGVLGVCALAVALGYTQNLGPGSLQPSAEQPASKPPSVPSPSKSGAPPSSSADTGPSTRPGGQDGRTKPPSGDGEDGDGSSPAVRGAALEWLFGKTGDAATEDSTGEGHDGRAVGTPPPKPQGSNGMAFFGQQSVTSRGPVLDTDRSFTVSARVKLRTKDDYQTVVSQDGAEISSFQLQYDAVEDRWEMRMHRTDSQTSPADEAESDAAPRAGRWTHLTGVWDASGKRISLYVDGRLEDTVRRAGDSSSEGEFAVGRARLGDRFIRGLDGNVKDVRAYPKALTETQVRSLADEE